MYRKLVALVVLAICTVFTGSASAQKYDWARRGDVALCLRSHPASDPCSRVAWTFYIWPNMLRELEKALAEHWEPLKPQGNAAAANRENFGPLGGLALPNPLDPDSPQCPVCRTIFIESLMLNERLLGAGGNVSSLPVFSSEARLKNMRVMRNALAQTLKSFDAEIKALESADMKAR
jgi:hypothetical protein